MKRHIIAVLLLAVLFGMATYAGGNQGSAVKAEYIRVGLQGKDPPSEWAEGWDYEGGLYALIGKEFTEKTGVAVIVEGMPESDDALKSRVDSRLEDKEPGFAYDMLHTYAGKIGTWTNGRYAVNLRDYLENDFFELIDQTALRAFNPNMEDEIYVIPETAWVMSGNLNMTLAEKAGFKVPEGYTWTLEQFEEMAEKIKKNVPGAYGAMMTGTGSYEMLGWFGMFGAEVWVGQKPNFDTPEALKALTYMKKIVDNEWCPPSPAEKNWGSNIEYWAKGIIGFSVGGIGWYSGAENGVTNGWIEKVFEVKHMEHPTVPGVARRGLLAGSDAFMLFDNKSVAGEALGEAKIKASVAFLEHIIRGGVVEQFGTDRVRVSPMANPKIPAIKNERLMADYNQVMDIVAVNGYYNHGLGSRVYGKSRPLIGSAMQGVFIGTLAPKEALEHIQSELMEELGY